MQVILTAIYLAIPPMYVLLTEDNRLIASGIVAGLEAQGFSVTHAATAGQADSLLRTARFDLMILDLGLPDEDGLHFLERLRRRGLELPVLILTARDAVLERVSGLQAGADDYLVKPFDLRELAARLHALLRRAAGRATQVIEHGPLSYNPAECTAFMAGEPVDLSRREQALLQALLQNPTHVLSAEQLKDAIYGFADDVESNALNVHIHHLRRKLGNGIVETVRGFGYRLGSAGHALATTRAPDQ